MDEPILARLEAAEMRARERRLEASSEAERRIEAARVAAAEVEGGTDRAISDAVSALRQRFRQEAALQVREIEADLARLEAAPSSGPRGDHGSAAPRAGDERVEAAVALVVRAVLGEAGR